MKISRLIMALGLALVAMLAAPSVRAEDPAAWPPITRETRPWTYWWWMGSEVEPAEITRLLETYQAAGLGGVHVIPIYGVQGEDDREVDFLSPEWMDLLAHASDEAHRLGLGLDLTTGTGWPYGGPQITPEWAAKTAVIAAGRVIVKGTGQKVKRAAPGGEGLVLDYFSNDAIKIYLERFDRAFAGRTGLVRSFYHDSYEVYGADWTPGLREEFLKRRGYDLYGHLGALEGRGDGEEIRRVRCDYRETMAELLLERFTEPWVKWCHAHGALARDQAHGSPGNLLDLYAAADVAETEAFGPSRFSIPGLDYSHPPPASQGAPDPLVMKFASSASHLAGHRLTSSETATWLEEHFTVTLAQVKPEADQLFCAGINHVFFHGIAYSPLDETWPGRLFYAPTNFGPSNPWFRDLPALNHYIARTQAFLQAGRPDNDVLVYWPIHDLWSGVDEERPGRRFARRLGESLSLLGHGEWKAGADEVKGAVVEYYNSRRGRLQLLTVHEANRWLHPTSFGRLARELDERGWSFDYVSDRLLATARVESGRITAGDGSYGAVVVPRCRYLPVRTLRKLGELQRGGAVVIFAGALPEGPPGLSGLARRREEFQSSLKNFTAAADPLEALTAAGVRREKLVDAGLRYLRRGRGDGKDYFIADLEGATVDGWLPLATPAVSALIFDPLAERRGKARLRRGEDGGVEVYVQLEPGQSLVVRTFMGDDVAAEPWPYLGAAGEIVDIQGPWRVEFIAGGPALPPPFTTDKLESWTERGPEYAAFSGTAVYRTEFTVDGDPAQWLLELGRVAESARVRINGSPAGVVLCHPFRLRVGGLVRPGVNRLEIEVTNLAANRIADLDRRGIRWKRFKDINFVDVNYLPFTASGWEPFPSGLLGPVRLTARSNKDFD